jgi:hypothetical protein
VLVNCFLMEPGRYSNVKAANCCCEGPDSSVPAAKVYIGCNYLVAHT